MKKKLVLLLVAVFVTLQSFAQAKYVFYFIGDGMGVNTVNLTEMYLAAKNGERGYGQLTFTGFPVCSMATTWCMDTNVTDSAASGTALACGEKTNKGCMGVDANGARLTSAAEIAKAEGKKVAIVTTVGANHATPAVFFGHQQNRNMYDELGYDMVTAGFDFYAGSEMIRSHGKDKKEVSPSTKLEEAGYRIVHSMEEYHECFDSCPKMVLIPKKESRVEFAIDRESTNSKAVSLKQMVEAGIEMCTRDKKSKGFFIMAEGGKIDGCNHGNDAATSIKEIIDFDEAIQVAYQFYLQHPKETAIIVTADHDTGGMSIKTSSPEQLAAIDAQKISEGRITGLLKEEMKKKGAEPMAWEEIKEFLSKHLGLWKDLKVSNGDEKMLYNIYTRTIAKNEAGNKSDEYGYNHDASIVSAAVDVANRICGVSWSTTGHTAGYVPVYAIGVGSERFHAKTDNAEIGRNVKAIVRRK